MPSGDDGGAVGRHYAGKSASERAAARRQRILDAALELFARQGWRGTTVAQLAATSAVSPRALYAEFANRTGLLLALYDVLAEQSLAAVTAAVAAARRDGADMDSLIAAGLGAYVRFVTDDPRRCRIIHQEVRAAGVALAHRRHGALLSVVDTLQPATAADGDTLSDARGARVAVPTRPARTPAGLTRIEAIALVGAVNEVLADWVSDAAYPAVEIIDELAPLLAASVRVALSA